jgi:transcriptional regulator with XRE-family HTH domain
MPTRKVRGGETRIATARRNAGLTQAEASALAGVTPQAWADVERGRRSPRLDTLLRMAKALDLPVSALIE